MSDPRVFHFTLTRSPDGRDVERLATLAVEPSEYQRMGAAAIEAVVESERRNWQRLVVAKYGPGWAVRVARERGYIRSIFPGAALRPTPAEPVLSVPGQEGN